jgi:hypothetical protein
VAVASATALILVVTAGLAFAGSAGKLDRSFGDRATSSSVMRTATQGRWPSAVTVE